MEKRTAIGIQEPYGHFTQYYETDQMGIIHHSNFIRWMEEARVDWMDKIGFGYDTMEKRGISCPVCEISCKYKEMVHFHQWVLITVNIRKYTGIRLYIDYEITGRDTHLLHATASSTHCFLDKKGNVVMLRKTCPELDQKLKELSELSLKK